MTIAFLPKVRSERIMASAHGKKCSLRLPGVCNHNAATTVWAHLPGIGKGVGTKVSDLHGAYACSACHDSIDRFTWERQGLTAAIVLDAMLRGLAETQAQLIAEEILVVPGAEIL